MKEVGLDILKLWGTATEIQSQVTVEILASGKAEYYCTQPGFPEGCIARGMHAHKTWPEPCKSCEWDTVWIPTSDDLERIWKSEDSIYDNIKDLSNWIETEMDADYLWRFFFDLGDVLLAYIMATQYSKVWDGNKWQEADR